MNVESHSTRSTMYNIKGIMEMIMACEVRHPGDSHEREGESTNRACQGVRCSQLRLGNRFWCDPRFDRVQQEHQAKYRALVQKHLSERPTVAPPALQYQVRVIWIALALARSLTG